MASISRIYKNSIKTTLKKVDQLSKNTLSKKQFEKVAKREQPAPSNLQQRAAQQVYSAQATNSKIRTTAPGSNPGRVTGTTPSSFYVGGGIDTTFLLPYAGINDMVATIALASNNDIYIGGNFDFINSTEYNFFAKANSIGELYSGFNQGTYTFNDYVTDTVVQSNGKVLVSGYFTGYSASSQNHLMRFNSDGTIDNSFNIGTGFDSHPEVIRLQSDGKILAGGDFSEYSGSSANGIVRLNSNGTIDTTFLSSSAFNYNITGRVRDIAIQDDGKILVGGIFTTYSGSSSPRLIRLNANGTIDNTFNVGTGFDADVYSIAIQNDGCILVGGNFTSYSGSSYNRIIRLYPNGTIDNTLVIGTGFDDIVNVVRAQPDTDILVGGQFTTYNGTSIGSYMTKLKCDGTRDTNFETGTGYNNYVTCIEIQPDSKILIGGWFTEYNGVSVDRIVRVFPGLVCPP